MNSTIWFLVNDMKKQRIYNGIDLIDQYLPKISGARMGLITNPTGVNRQMVTTIDILHSRGLLACLFSPEHGIRGGANAGEHIGNYTDSITGMPVYSLYGSNVNIQPENMENIDIVAFDIQDIGARYYTYTSTLAYAMEDCAKAGKQMLIFDRINPIGGEIVEGSVLNREFSSFVGRYPVPVRHGMTVGEYAKYINDTESINCDLTVIPVDGWERSLYFDETDLCWVTPSPNMPTVDTAICYIGTCLAEGTNLSEGRGTTKPFEIFGAPWLNSRRVAEEFNSRQPEGYILRPCDFTPFASKYANIPCNGIQIHITDRNSFKPFEAALRIFDFIRKTHREFEFNCTDGNYFIDLLLGSDQWRKEDFDVDAYLKNQKARLDEFKEKRKQYLMY